MVLPGYKTIIFNALKVILAIALHYGFADFSPDPAVDAFIQNVAAFCLLVETAIAVVLRITTKTAIFKGE